jgi:urease accessory protein
MNNTYASALLIVGLVLSNAVHAHIGGHADGGFGVGLMHPFSGADHMLAMIAVGMWAVQAGGRNLLVVPATFVAAMALGAVVGAGGGYVPFAESGMAVSVLLMGLLLAFAIRGSWQWAVPVTAACALFHGYAHGISIPEFSDPARYFAGFLMATLVLHVAGAVAALMLRDQARALRTGGLAISLAGLWLLRSLY